MTKSEYKGISSFTLHILAMSLMLCDHLWATIFPAQEWLTCLGRIAFPIFAFMIAEGYYKTSDVKKYILRILLFALISEIPFNLITGSSVFYPYHQNVLWTFLIALLSICLIEKVREKEKWWLTAIVSALVIGFDFLFGMVTMVDYFGCGILTVLIFYFFRKRNFWCLLAQIILLAYLNIEVLGGYCYDVELFGFEFQIVQQGLALLALIPIWLYKGEQGYHSKPFKYFCYGFYPAHLLILYFVWQSLS
ncbi:MAG: TraX family protein [Acutalibacteraceae bacterium]